MPISSLYHSKKSQMQRSMRQLALVLLMQMFE
jgi:hypothetical protein